MPYLTENWVEIALAVFVLANLYVNLTPSESDNKALARIRKLFDKLALNITSNSKE